tara:strand:+ start:1169 stop:1441 length:273 start_codon:yes stop_codon:yes gene_type:complete
VFEILKPCQNCKSFVLKPKKKISINLEKISEEIGEKSFEILAFTGSMLSVKKECKINIYNSGKIAIMTKDLNHVQKLADELENVLNEKKL